VHFCGFGGGAPLGGGAKPRGEVVLPLYYVSTREAEICREISKDFIMKFSYGISF
jgi:hypothetical protein